MLQVIAWGAAFKAVGLRCHQATERIDGIFGRSFSPIHMPANAIEVEIALPAVLGADRFPDMGNPHV